MWVLGVYVYLAVFYLIKKIDVNSIYKVNRRIRLILTFKSSASMNLYYKCIGGPCIVVPFLVQTLLELLWIRQKSMDSFYKVELGNQCGRELASKKAHTTWYLLSMQFLTRVYLFQHNTVQMSYKWHLLTYYSSICRICL